MIKCRRFEVEDFEQVYRMMDEAFSDYVVKVDMSRKAYQRKFDFENVRFEHSVGAFEGEKLVGATMNAVGTWNGKPTVYDSGTGVIPACRRKGVSRAMFDFILPSLRESGFEQYLLEVIKENNAAEKLYKSFGFEVSRELLIFKQINTVEPVVLDEGVQILELDDTDWNRLRSFWDIEPSWQNSIDWIKRARNDITKTVVFGVYLERELVGYGVVSEVSGKISQIAIANEYRRKGYAKALVCELQKHSKKPLVMTNIDTNATGVLKFLKSCGFEQTISQYEMMKIL